MAEKTAIGVTAGNAAIAFHQGIQGLISPIVWFHIGELPDRGDLLFSR